MSKHEIVKSLRAEIRKVNRIIDQKIIYGKPYYLESRRHRFLMSQLKRITPQRTSIFGRSLSFASMFML